MEEKIMSDRTCRIMFYIMTIAMVIIALKPTKITVIGDNSGEIKLDNKAHGRPPRRPDRPKED